jgi:hypothetical protein
MLHRPPPTAENNPIPFLPGWLVREWVGVAGIVAWLVVLPVVLGRTVFRYMKAQMGLARYTLMVLLLLSMALIPAKLVLRWVLGVKYFIYLPEMGANL